MRLDRRVGAVWVACAALARVTGAQESGDRPAFEAASIKLHPPNASRIVQFSPYGTGRYTITAASLSLLVQLAYGFPEDQIAGNDKLGSGTFDVAVKAEDGVKLDYPQLKPRLQRLLEERFHLATHRSTKESQTYVLVKAKGGPKLTATSDPPGQGTIAASGLFNSSATMAGLAGMLQIALHRPVVDKTEIDGNYRINLKANVTEVRDSSLPSVFTALEEQLGLKLESHKMTVEALVIDRCDKLPSEN